jgi:hemoglobin-like flavoprotein
MPPLCTEDARTKSAACTQQDNLQHSKTQKLENPQHEEMHKHNNRLERKSFNVFSRQYNTQRFQKEKLRKNILFKSEVFSGCTMQENFVRRLEKKCVSYGVKNTAYSAWKFRYK